MTATDCVCSPNDWSADASSGRRPRAARFRLRERSYRCCWKALIGGGWSARGTRNCRCNARGSFAQLFSRGEDGGSESSCDTPRMSVVALPDLNVLPAEALRALILAQHQQLLSRESENRTSEAADRQAAAHAV